MEEDPYILHRMLRNALANANPERFLKGLWALNALQTERAEHVGDLIRRYPQEAIDAQIGSKFAVHPWEIETLANEMLANETQSLLQFFEPEDWSHWAQLVSHLRKLENAEHPVFNESSNIIDHLFVIASRQFEWQEGVANKGEMFRGLYVYGQGLSADFFQETYGISVDDFFSAGFAVMAMLNSSPSFPRNLDFSDAGFSNEIVRKALELFVTPISEARRRAKQERGDVGETAFKPSLLRQFPCIAAGHRDRYIFAPLPELVVRRATTGLFYDVVGGGQSIREDYGRRFEEFSFKVLRQFQPELTVTKEETYKTKLGEFRTPDLLISNNENAVEIIVECKATRMAFETRFLNKGEDKISGYSEMVKAVFQIWRFAHHSRLGLAKQKLAKDAVGLVLTLDAWFQAAPERQRAVKDSAMEIFEQKFPDYDPTDLLPIAFTHSNEFEGALRYGTPATVVSAIKTLSSSERLGYSLWSAHDEVLQQSNIEKGTLENFPFEEDMRAISPFWDRLSSVGKNR